MDAADPSLTQAPAAPAAPAAASVPSAPASPQPDYQAELAALRAENEAARQILSTLEPYADDIRWMTADEANARGVREYRDAFEKVRKPPEPELSQDGQLLKKYIDESFGPLAKNFQEQQRAQEAAEKAKTETWLADQRQYAQRLKAERKFDDPTIQKIGAYADGLARVYGRQVGLEEAYKEMTALGGASAPDTSSSLRADAGAPGIPGPSDSNLSADYRKDFYGTLVKTLKADRKTA